MTSNQHNDGQSSFDGKALPCKHHDIRMRLILALLSLLLAPMVSAHAQSRDTGAWDAKALSKKPEPAVAQPKKERAGGMKACPEYGAGFYRLAGSDTCVRSGGSSGSDIGTSGVR